MRKFYPIVIFTIIFFGTMWKTADLLAEKLTNYSLQHYTSEIENGNYNVFEQSVYYKYYDNTTNYEISVHEDVTAQIYIGQINKHGSYVNSYEFKLFSESIDLTDEITIKMSCDTTSQIQLSYEERYTNNYNKNIIGVYIDENYIYALNCPDNEKVTVSISNVIYGELLKVNSIEPRFTDEMLSNIESQGTSGYSNNEYIQYFVKDARPLNIIIVPFLVTAISLILYKFVYINKLKK